MRAIRFHELGGPEVLRVEDAPDPTPKPGQVLLGLHALDDGVERELRGGACSALT